MLVVSREIGDNDPRRILRSHGFLRFDRRVRTGRVVEHALQTARPEVNEYLELNSIETIVALVRENVGVTVLPQLHRGNWQNGSVTARAVDFESADAAHGRHDPAGVI